MQSPQEIFEKLSKAKDYDNEVFTQIKENLNKDGFNIEAFIQWIEDELTKVEKQIETNDGSD
ncbi:MAG TPA: hypothetical protein ENI52_06465 [Thermoplasmata archaeon]|nr:hypothetical protein [Thermoplasmata archaeon]